MASSKQEPPSQPSQTIEKQNAEKAMQAPKAAEVSTGISPPLDKYGFYATLSQLCGADSADKITPLAYESVLILAKDFVNSFLSKLDLPKKRITLEMVKDYIETRTSKEVKKHAQMRGLSACERLSSKEPSKETIKTDFILEQAKTLKPEYTFDENALAYLNACLDYLFSEIFELSWNVVRDYRQTKVTVKFIRMSIENDLELLYVWPDVKTLLSGEDDPALSIFRAASQTSKPSSSWKTVTTEAVEIKLQPSTEGNVTKDVVIGNFMNAIEGAYDVEANQSSTWLNDRPPKNFVSGTVLVRDVSMRIPAMVGTWKAAHLYSNHGCCGAMFWHTTFVGPDEQAAANLIRDFSQAGMQVIENVELEQTANMGLRLIGRYSWDYYREYKGNGSPAAPDRLYDLYGFGPHCYFIDAENYKNVVCPDIVSRAQQLEQGHQNVQFQPYVSKVNESGALAIFSGQEYMFAKIFLQPSLEPDTERKWLGVRAILVFTYNIPETWQECRIENAPIQ
jgi:hypothetical protein